MVEYKLLVEDIKNKYDMNNCSQSGGKFIELISQINVSIICVLMNVAIN